MPVYTDQCHRELMVTAKPRRIVSLVPSQTELLHALGLKDEVVGITKFCVHPAEWFVYKTRVGGTKTVKLETVRSLRPDLIIANKEENIQAQVEELQGIAPVWVSDVNTVTDALEMIGQIGVVTGTERAAALLVQRITQNLATWQPGAERLKRYRTAYLIWKDPYMAAAGDTYISDVMRLGAFENVLGEMSRYPVITPELLMHERTELVLLSSEPYPFRQRHIDALQAELPGVKIILADGEMFSWYGSRMAGMADYFRTLRNVLAAGE